MVTTPGTAPPLWQFAIDVGGTFTDCVAISPRGQVRTFKTLSSGRTKGTVSRIFDLQILEDPIRSRDADGFWIGARLFVTGGPAEGLPILDSHAGGGRLRLEGKLPPTVVAGTPYEIVTGEEAPVLGIRWLLGLRLGEPLPPCDVKLGTTRGTNALLERRGARVGFVTTKGFGDILLIGDQARPKLFELAIRKPEPLFQQSVEVDERLAADGAVLIPLDRDSARARLEELRQAGIDSVAIALLHAYRNPVHEQALAAMARELGFREVVTSHEVSSTIKLVPRGESTVVDAYLNPILRDYVTRIASQLQGETHAGTGKSEMPPFPRANAERFERFLSEKGLRPTQERSLILEAILAFPKAFEVEELVQHLALSPGGGRISRSTVYRTLNLLHEAGDLQVITTDLFPDRYELVPASSVRSGTRLQLMTSSGGLVEPSAFSGRDSILSGPAGGVIGFSLTAARAGFPRSIGFDMGGTSTDVSRYDGRWELEYESRKAGVRITAPMLAIETVAAGGGSICRFDGVKLVVGPESAGSDPGPACYGRGGPLTITDCNVALGRIVTDHFPFVLDRDAIDHRLEELAAVVEHGTGQRMSPEEIAAGFIDIANAHMARAIRRISIAKGYDPADYALAVFGGAGAQHACALARQLGMTDIVIHPLAGALSAYGIACADAVQHASRSLLRPLSEFAVGQLDAVFAELETEVRTGLNAAEGSVGLVRSLDLRYLGLESAVTIVEPKDGNYAAAYEAEHERQFGYRRSGRAIEAVVARVEGRVSRELPPSPGSERRWKRGDETRVVIAGGWRTCPTFVRDPAGVVESVGGPALLAESMTTVFVEEGFRAAFAEDGSIVLRYLGGADRQAQDDDLEHPHPVRLEVFNNQFASIAEQMGETLRRTSVSTNVKERLDYSCAVFDGQGALVVNAPHIPVHLGAMAQTVQCVLRDNPDLKPGDVVLTNDPFRGGSHLPDLTVVTPVFDDAGAKILFVVASRAHHAEIGGIVPGSMPPFSRNLAEEGVLIRNFHVVRQGAFQEEELRQRLGQTPGNSAASPVSYPSRRPDDNVADIMAQIAANQTGVRLLGRLAAEESLPVVERYMRFIREAAARKVRQALAARPDGEVRCVDYLDDGTPIAVRITITGDQATVDFEGTGPVLATNLNANSAIVTAAVLYVFRTLIDEEIPLNGGVLDPVTIRIPECLLNPPPHDDPRRCAAIVGGNVETSQRVVDVLLAALGLAAASQGTMNNLTFGDGTFGYYETICGGSGATSGADGADAVHTHMTNTRLTDPEILEHRYPVRLRRFAIRRGSGGPGQHSGGDGIVRELEFLAPLSVSILSQRRGAFPPPGLQGGTAGAIGNNRLIHVSGDTEDLGGCAQREVVSGERLVIETPGGGGFGTIPSEGG
ncbi:hydantoinase B/oxoprolinase family protein [Planctomyces sp. SH-PL14]|uniref:hydantoinase B/oxoprolinase family protein n=1 Tax=Planctomyces sp. SH-PL14 TaxID=1632864 RepID=UPI00078BD645|nr:hydantoinase B/oxoprolinase family protein [Planctomyces sp. SH-PL14]AMV22140.1 Acetone carboxylase beta subunit [Planctomyces sp. SH-PL14]